MLKIGLIINMRDLWAWYIYNFNKTFRFREKIKNLKIKLYSNLFNM